MDLNFCTAVDKFEFEWRHSKEVLETAGDFMDEQS